MKKMILIALFIGLIPSGLQAQEPDWFQKGLNARETKDQILYYTKSIEAGAEVSASYFCRASARLGQGDVQGAIEDYSKCIEIDSNDRFAYYNRGMAKMRIDRNDPGAVEDINTSCELYAIEHYSINPANGINLNPEDYFCMAIYYQKVLKRYPEDASVYGRLGYCYLGLGNDTLAYENFSKSISLEPGKVDALLGLALLAYYKNEPALAKKYLDEALKTMFSK